MLLSFIQISTRCTSLNLTVTKVRRCPNQHLTQWNNTSKPVHTPMVCKVRLELLKMGVARNM
jgi:hypothetical protein